MAEMTNTEIAEKVESEGLGYLVTDGLSADSIADPVLAALWERAADDLAAIQRILDRALAANADAPAEDDADESVVLNVAYDQLMLDRARPSFFDGAQVNRHGNEFKLGVHGGKISYYLDSSHIEHYVSFQGEFTLAELKRALREIAPYVADHIHQSVTATDDSGMSHYFNFLTYQSGCEYNGQTL